MSVNLFTAVLSKIEVGEFSPPPLMELVLALLRI